MSSRSTVAPLALAVGMLLVSMVSYQCGASLAKHLFPLVGAQGATAYRLGLSALLLLLWRRPWRHAGRRDWRVLWGYGLAMGAMNLVFYLSLRTIPLGIAVALEFTGPLALALFGSRRWLDFVWIALVVAGLALLLPLRGQLHALDPAGVMYALAAGAGWALYIVLGKKAGATHGADAVTLGTSIGALLAIPFGIAHAGSALLSPALLPYALGVAVLSSALPYSLEMVALTRLPARTFSTLLSLEPAIAAVAGVALLGERLSLLQWLAIATIIVAAAGTALSVQRPALAEPLAN
ncbi:EamA family transporter [Rhodanobacter denitrificans]|uniref:Putative permease, DMT superfamily n=1 Tax=Rhodanobacter denitrificans TaxID=666685 RepID=M4NNP8_9GAMM|nr:MULTISPECIES: EamA family transporter [Rhodanobacter]AGG89311.1 putative permease, DMT superfamily [Rhodanobacter denitrificans]UJM88197.1 EamA family transporter [Rhodanobacter denitrificans]UJM88795.1 EamA family transporter [Rhodanobacter denitrificans]